MASIWLVWSVGVASVCSVAGVQDVRFDRLMQLLYQDLTKYEEEVS